MTVKIEIKNVYGRQLIYILDAKFKKIFQDISGRETLNISDVDNFRSLGVEFQTVAPKL